MEYELDARCANCGYTFGEHCTADDACPIYARWGKNGSRVNHGGFNRASKFSTTANNNPKGKGENLADEYEAAVALLAEAKRELALAEEALEAAVDAMIRYLEANVIRPAKKQV
jgi:hypothetical protein